VKDHKDAMRYAQLFGQYLPFILSAVVGLFQTLQSSRASSNTSNSEEQVLPSNEELPVFGELSQAFQMIGHHLTILTKMMIAMIAIQMMTITAQLVW